MTPPIYSRADLKRIQREINEFVSTREDGVAKSASSVGRVTVLVWIRTDAPQLWEAIAERFGAAVEVRWGASYHGWSARPQPGGPTQIAP